MSGVDTEPHEFIPYAGTKQGCMRCAFGEDHEVHNWINGAALPGIESSFESVDMSRRVALERSYKKHHDG